MKYSLKTGHRPVVRRTIIRSFRKTGYFSRKTRFSDILTCLLFSSIQILAPYLTSAQNPASRPPAQPQGQKLTPAQEAEIIAKMQAEAKKFTIPQLKTALEQSPNPVLYAKQILQKRFKIDTIIVTRTRNFSSLADSLAYTGKTQKVYGPYGEKGSRFLVQLLTKAPNQFYHISQIFIDTSIFRYRIADSLGNLILRKLKDSAASFDQLAKTYSMGGEGGGDLGWIARGAMVPQIEHEVNAHKKGEVFRVWSVNGLHIIRKVENPRQDTGFALMMRVWL
ncbi:MAG TPA: peptidylprolyl isomerase [Puia sp.]|nr:peptidylprolyl isomerase [Puia sp.]